MYHCSVPGNASALYCTVIVMLASIWVREAVSFWAVATNHTHAMRRFMWVIPSRTWTLPFEVNGFQSLFAERLVQVSEREEPSWDGFNNHILT